MKFVKNFIKIVFGSNIVVFIALIFLPAFIVADQVDLFERMFPISQKFNVVSKLVLLSVRSKREWGQV